MRSKGVARIADKRAFDLTGAARDVAEFDARPAEIGEEPPIVAPVPRQAFEQRQLRLVVVDPPAKAQQPEHPQRQSQHQTVARIVGDVLLEQRLRLRPVAVDREGDRLDVPRLARRDPAGEDARLRRRRLGFGHARLHLTEPRPRDVAEREIRVGGERPVEQRPGAGIGRQHQIDRGDIIRGRSIAGRAQGQSETVFKRHRVASRQPV